MGIIMFNGPAVILVLKIAVSAVTVLLGASLLALRFKRVRLHGFINAVAFGLTYATLLGLELLIRLIQPDVFAFIQENPDSMLRLRIHLGFAIPAALMMPVMLWTGYYGPRRLHLTLAGVFGIVWLGTWLTGVIGLPHD
jgi:hypothetical protein